jgi:hypothetical protein
MPLEFEKLHSEIKVKLGEHYRIHGRNKTYYKNLKGTHRKRPLGRPADRREINTERDQKNQDVKMGQNLGTDAMNNLCDDDDELQFI